MREVAIHAYGQLTGRRQILQEENLEEEATMKQKDIADWCDFVRGVADPETGERLQEQLDSGSRAAGRIESALRRVAAVGLADHEDPVPDHAVRLAKAIGVLQRPPAAKDAPGRTSPFRRLPFTIAFDSQLEGAPAGTRDLHAGHRQVLFEAERYSVEVRLEQEVEPPGTVVVGQVLSRGQALPEVPILLLADQRIVGRATSGPFGEFQAEGLPPNPLKLCVLPADGESLELPLDREAGPHPSEE